MHVLHYCLNLQISIFFSELPIFTSKFIKYRIHLLFRNSPLLILIQKQLERINVLISGTDVTNTNKWWYTSCHTRQFFGLTFFFYFCSLRSTYLIFPTFKPYFYTKCRGIYLKTRALTWVNVPALGGSTV